MPTWLTVTLLTFGAGLAMPAGAMLAKIERLRPGWLENELRHTVIAFGGGALLSAVALVLVPNGVQRLPVWGVAASFAGGGLVFMAIDYWLARQEASASQLVAMLADFVPESIALGAGFASGGTTGYLLAGLIALQNLPEGFNAYREIKAGSSNGSAKGVVRKFCLTAVLGPIAGLGGYLLLSHMDIVIGVLMSASAAGILYLTFQDIAPQASLEKRWFPPMGAVAGFLLGVIGEMLIIP